jgi:signal transduction histidine kinase
MRVRERTAEITVMNEHLRILSRRLIEIQEKERSNLARELHDQIGQSLNMIKILLDRVGSANDDDRQIFRKQAASMLTDLIDRVGDLSLELRPRILDDLGMVQALEWYFARFTGQTNIRVKFKPPDIDGLPMDITNGVYRVVQEALTNVARHARAKSVIVQLKYNHGNLQLQIEDNGTGFDPAALNTSLSGGIIGMKERICQLGGCLQIESEPGAGTRVIADIPYGILRRGKGGRTHGNHSRRR